MAATASIPALTAPSMQGPETRYEWIFLFLVGSLPSTILLKLGVIQYLELAYVIQLAVLGFAALRNGRVRVFRPLVPIYVLFALFWIAALALSISAAQRYDFYPPPGLGFARRPVIITVQRIIQLLLNVSIMLYLANLFRRFPGKARFTMRVYFGTGVASAVYSLISYPLAVAGIAEWGTYLVNHRLRGFFNEGGPYGIYLVSVAVVGYVLYRLRWETTRRLLISYALLAIVFPMSYSKAGFAALPLLFFLAGLFSRGWSTRLIMLAGFAIAIVVSTQLLDLRSGIRLYQKSAQEYERASIRYAGDGNFITGRVAGLFIVPRMIAAHPWAGIGWGNYGLLRNAPEYRGAASWVDIADDPSLGIIGLAADLGLPTLALLVFCIFMPFITIRLLRIPAFIANPALVLPVSQLCGAQLNITYPWVVASFALGLAYAVRQLPSGTTQRLPVRLLLVSS